MHTLHKDILRFGLQDDCPECKAHAESPWNTLDNEMLSALINRNFFYRYGQNVDRLNYAPRSDIEGVAMVNITNVMERMGKLLSCDPQNLMQSYFERVWDIEFEPHAG